MNRRYRTNQPAYFGRQTQVVVQNVVVFSHYKIKAELYPVRVLVGWLTQPADIGFLAGDHRTELDQREFLRLRDLIRAGNKARAALPHLAQGPIVEDLTPEFERHAIQWRGQPIAQAYIDEGWKLHTIHLPTVISLQEVVEQRKADSLMSSIHPGDPASLAALTLPIESNSFLQVAKLGKRYVLRNGYHRANALLRSGVESVPGLFRDVSDIAELTMPSGIFIERRIYSSARPPVLTDFLQPRLAATIH